MHACEQRALAADDLSQLRPLLEQAYASGDMWEYFAENIDAGGPALTFTLRDRAGAILATRTVGEVFWGDEYWGDAARALGVGAPVAGMSFTVARPARGRGLGGLLWRASFDWVARHTALPVLFGDTCSRPAVEMYLRGGAMFLTTDVARKLRENGAPDLPSFLDQTRGLEKIEEEIVRYLWPLRPGYAEKAAGIGYARMAVAG